MAERAIPTALLYQNVSRHLGAHASATAFAYLSLCTESMAGFSVDTTDFASELTRQAVTPTYETIAKTDDTIVMSKTGWTPGVSTVYGAGIFITVTATDANLQAFHEWATSVTFESSDTLTQTIKLQSKLGT